MSLRHASGVQDQLPAASFYGNPRVGYPHRQHLVRGASRCVSHLGYTSLANMKHVLKGPKTKQVLQHRLEALLPNLLFLFGRWGIRLPLKQKGRTRTIFCKQIELPTLRPAIDLTFSLCAPSGWHVQCLYYAFCNFQHVYLFVQFFCFVTLY